MDYAFLLYPSTCSIRKVMDYLWMDVVFHLDSQNVHKRLSIELHYKLQENMQVGLHLIYMKTIKC